MRPKGFVWLLGCILLLGRFFVERFLSRNNLLQINFSFRLYFKG